MRGVSSFCVWHRTRSCVMIRTNHTTSAGESSDSRSNHHSESHLKAAIDARPGTVPAGYPDFDAIVAQMSASVAAFQSICEFGDLSADDIGEFIEEHDLTVSPHALRELGRIEARTKAQRDRRR